MFHTTLFSWFVYSDEFILVSCSIGIEKNEQWIFISKSCCLMGLFHGFLSRPCIWHPCWSKPCGIMHWQLRLSCQNKAPLRLYWVPTCPWETKKVCGFPVDLGVKFGIFIVSMWVWTKSRYRTSSFKYFLKESCWYIFPAELEAVDKSMKSPWVLLESFVFQVHSVCIATVVSIFLFFFLIQKMIHNYPCSTAYL